MSDNQSSPEMNAVLADPGNPESSLFLLPDVSRDQLITSKPLIDEGGKIDEYLSGNERMPLVTPLLGRISLGSTVVSETGKRIPVKDNHFTVTSLVKNPNLEWIDHPLNDKLKAKYCSGKNENLKVIPIRLMYDSIDLNLQDGFMCFNLEGRLQCCGNGVVAKRLGEDGHSSRYSCPGPMFCEYGRTNGCKSYGRFYVQIEDQDDITSAFVLRTTGWNTISTLRFKLNWIKSVFGYLTNIPLKLVIRAKSSAQSMWAPFYFADIQVAKDIVELSEIKKAADEKRKLIEEFNLQFGLMEEVASTMSKRGGMTSFEDDNFDDVFDEFFSYKGSTEPGIPVASSIQTSASASTTKDNTNGTVLQNKVDPQPVIVTNPAPNKKKSGMGKLEDLTSGLTVT